jgi:hypothetical protein
MEVISPRVPHLGQARMAKKMDSTAERKDSAWASKMMSPGCIVPSANSSR